MALFPRHHEFLCTHTLADHPPHVAPAARHVPRELRRAFRRIHLLPNTPMRQHSAIVTITGRVYVPSEDVEAAFEAGELDGVEVVSREDAFEGLAHKRILEELFSY